MPCKSSWAIAKVSWLGLGGSGCMGSPMWCRKVHGSGPSGNGLGDFGEGLGDPLPQWDQCLILAPSHPNGLGYPWLWQCNVICYLVVLWY